MVNTAAAHLEARGQDHTADMGNFAERVPNVPTNHRLTWFPDGQEISSTRCQMRDSVPSTDEITKTLFSRGWRLKMRLGPSSSIQKTILSREFSTQWEEVVADIEVCMLYKGKGPRSLPQNQRFVMLITFGLKVVAKIVAENHPGAKAHKSRRSQFSHCQRTVWVQIEKLCPESGSGAHNGKKQKKKKEILECSRVQCSEQGKEDDQESRGGHNDFGIHGRKGKVPSLPYGGSMLVQDWRCVLHVAVK